ncbi:hypothetical protein QQF64_005070 [Cirrhinus molitorella]|uniref:Secreted protein n=1 Tax=Cirrhinus molitorella TaxID=172907 RepID=A0ABR3MJC9_9TELE
MSVAWDINSRLCVYGYLTLLSVCTVLRAERPCRCMKPLLSLLHPGDPQDSFLKHQHVFQAFTQSSPKKNRAKHSHTEMANTPTKWPDMKLQND